MSSGTSEATVISSTKAEAHGPSTTIVSAPHICGSFLLNRYTHLIFRDLPLLWCFIHLSLFVDLPVLGDDNRVNMIVHFVIDKKGGTMLQLLTYLDQVKHKTIYYSGFPHMETLVFHSWPCVSVYWCLRLLQKYYFLIQYFIHTTVFSILVRKWPNSNFRSQQEICKGNIRIRLLTNNYTMEEYLL